MCSTGGVVVVLLLHESRFIARQRVVFWYVCCSIYLLSDVVFLVFFDVPTHRTRSNYICYSI